MSPVVKVKEAGMVVLRCPQCTGSSGSSSVDSDLLIVSAEKVVQ